MPVSTVRFLNKLRFIYREEKKNKAKKKTKQKKK